jgi:2-keto-4-pentenoate hydratase
MQFDQRAAIDRFWQAFGNAEHVPAEWVGRLTMEQAYDVQLGVIARRVAAGERQVGWKVGLTSAAIQRQFGYFEPVFGCLLDEGRKASGHVFGRDELFKPGFETELCLQLREPLTGKVDTDGARRAIGHCFPALEIIETRAATTDMAFAMADNAQQKAFILGAPIALADLDLSAVEARVAINGEAMAQGRGDAVLGDPLNSVAWLAEKLASRGLALAAGDMIMTGSFVRQFPLAPGDRARAEFAGVGAVEVAIAS